MKLRNVSPLGAVVIPALRVTVEAGEVFDAPDDVAEGLLAGDFEAAGDAGLDGLSKAELVARAEELGLDASGTKAEILARIKESA
jgi:hypothetical protein